MSIEQQLSKLSQNLVNARSAIVYKGGSVGDTPAFNNLANEIESIPSGDANYVLVDDTDTAYKKQILVGASPLAKLKSIGGMTYKKHKPDGNLLPYPYISKNDNQGTFSVTMNDFNYSNYVYVSAVLVDSTNAFKLPKGTYAFALNAIVDFDYAYSPWGMITINGEQQVIEREPYATFTFDTDTLITSVEVSFEWMVDVGTVATITGSISPVLRREGEDVAFSPRQMELVDTKVPTELSPLNG